MAKLVAGLFDRMDRATIAVQELQRAGFSSDSIEVKTGEELIAYAQRSRRDDEDDGLWTGVRRFFEEIGLSSGERDIAGGELRGVTSSDTLVMLDAADEQAERAADILDECGAVDVDERLYEASQVPAVERQEPQAKPAGKTTRTASTRVGEEQQKIPVVEEEIKVGKRAVKRGGVRVYSRMVERPVEEQVNLKEEKVRVERRPVGREVQAGEEPFKEQTVEMRETAEEPVVEKKARVKEEVRVSKEAGERTETIRETVRATEVKVESLSPEEEREFVGYESQFRNDYQSTYAARGIAYDEIRPGYQYGYHIGRDPGYDANDWSAVESKVRRDWEEHHYGPWDRFKDAVRSGWERAHH